MKDKDKYREIYIGVGSTLERAMELLRDKAIEFGEPVCAEFNGTMIDSNMLLDDVYKAVIGVSQKNAVLFDDIWPFIHGLVLDLSKDKSFHDQLELLHQANVDFKAYLSKEGLT